MSSEVKWSSGNKWSSVLKRCTLKNVNYVNDDGIYRLFYNFAKIWLDKVLYK